MVSVKAKADESEGEKAAMQDHIQTLKVTVRQPAEFFSSPPFFPHALSVVYGMVHFCFHIVSNFNSLKTLTLLVHAGLF